MKYTKLIFTGAVTAVAIAASYKVYQDYDKRVKSKRALNRIKSLFENQDEITGTWLDDTPQEYRHDNFKTQAYFGSLIKQEGDQQITYKFVLSAKNFALLDLQLAD